ncbi:MAG TPA: hypothetical protein VIK35_06995 [Verrucomicrobiae bacterium]
MKHFFLCFAAAGLLTTSGCAWYNITPISKSEATNWAADPQNGYIISQPELYFAATITETTSTNKDVKQDITVAPLYLPNPYKAYRVTTHNFLAKADFTFNFENGWKLTQIADKSDNTTVASALANQLTTILKATGVPLTSSAPSETRVFLYKPEYGDDGTITNFSETGEIKMAKNPAP